jgi:hypothetical protein
MQHVNLLKKTHAMTLYSSQTVLVRKDVNRNLVSDRFIRRRNHVGFRLVIENAAVH